MILVPLFDLKFLKRARGKRCRNFKSAAPSGGCAIFYAAGRCLRETQATWGSASMGKSGIVAVAALALLSLALRDAALAASKGMSATSAARSAAAAASEVSSQTRRRAHTRITVYPRGYE